MALAVVKRWRATRPAYTIDTVRYMDVWQLQSRTAGCLALVLALCVALASGEAAAQGKKSVKAPWVGKTAEGKPCQGGQPTSGPFDYLQRRQHAGPLRVVEENHFDSNVENLIKGISTEPMGDIDFTLRAFPNHHRALNSAVKFRLRHKRWPQKSKGVQAECYLQRAINFSPNDPVAYALLGYTLHKLGNPQRAVEPYKTAIEQNPGDMMLKYNLALALTDLKRYRQARKYAEEVYAVGFPLPALQRRLEEVGHWEGFEHNLKEPAPAKAKAKKKKKKGKKENQFAQAMAREKAADDQAAAPGADEGGEGLSKKEQFAAAIAAMQAEQAAADTEAADETAQGESAEDAAGGDQEEPAEPAKAQSAAGAQAQAEGGDAAPAATGEPLSKKEQFAAAIAALQAQQGGEAATAAGADDGELSNKEKFAAAIAAQRKQEGKPAGDGSKMTKQEQFAAALAAQAKKGETPTLSDVDPETRKEQFAAKLAAKGLLETEGEEEDAVEATAAEASGQTDSAAAGADDTPAAAGDEDQPSGPGR